ncbi:MAG: NUDIX hydrolase [Planctomycetota bacterium]|nr:MAG: NUDIX hydrolase [Planctomycetota bacterium]
MEPVSLEVLEDRSAESRCDEGFLRLRRLRVRHRYADGRHSSPYACDVVSRRRTDAVAAVIWFRGPGGRPGLVLKAGVRPPVYLRRQRELVQPDPQAPLVLVELVAGVLEAEDGGVQGLQRRAAAECLEEVGLTVEPACFQMLGQGTFPSPGITDEKVSFVMVELPGSPDLSALPAGDGSGMEEGTQALVMELQEAIEACRTGRIPDMKTEVGLQRLAHSIGWCTVRGRWLNERSPA